MLEINVPDKIKQHINLFVDKLKSTLQEDLVSISIYGSAVSNEFVDNHSDVNFLIVLKNTDLQNLKRISKLTEKFPLFQPLFLTQAYITSSVDIFPIEFLDMQENYLLIYGKDVLKELRIDIKNLRFQCEQELKIKLIGLRQFYLRNHIDKPALLQALLKTFTSVLHISKNILRLKEKPLVYKKELVINGLSEVFIIDINLWRELLSAKNKKTRLRNSDIESNFISFTNELQKLVDYVDKL
ncbi:MAG: hypothetical protein NTZ63_01500 [Candidatus Omnitrophica bacterium]|nr:hypothetical protein [Candidatus Omnitrophota bacterium]